MSRLQHWSEIGENSVVWGMRLLLWIFRHGGRAFVQVVLYPVVAYYWLVSGRGRAASQDYLNRVAEQLPPGVIKTGWRGTFFHFMTFAEAILDKLAAWADPTLLGEVAFEGRDELFTRLSSGRGVLLLGSHLGNLEVCRALAQFEKDIRITVLVHTRHAEQFNALLGHYNPVSRMNLIQVTAIDAAISMLLADKIEQGEIVIVAADRTPVGNRARVVCAEFLGALAPFPEGPFVIASLLNCPVLTVFCLKRQAQYTVYFEPFTERLQLPRGKRREVLAETVQRFAGVLEQHCLQQPLQWFNFFPFWNLD